MTFESNEKFKDPKLRARVVKLRGEGNAWISVVDAIEKEFGIKMSQPTAQKIFNKTIAGKTITSPKARDIFQAEYSDIKIRVDKMFERMEKLNKIIDDLYKKYDSNTPETFLKYVPTLLAILRENLAQLQFIRNDQEKIIMQQKNLIYSPIQIIQKIDQHMRQLEKEGKIKVLVSELSSESKSEEEE